MCIELVRKVVIHFLYMTLSIGIIIFFGVIISTLLIVILSKQSIKKEETNDQTFLILQDQLERLRNTVENKLERSATDLHQTLHRQNTEANRLISDITRELTEVKEGNKQVFSMTEQLQNLEKVLTHQKQRGNLGEAALEQILSKCNITSRMVKLLMLLFIQRKVLYRWMRSTHSIIISVL